MATGAACEQVSCTILRLRVANQHWVHHENHGGENHVPPFKTILFLGSRYNINILHSRVLMPWFHTHDVSKRYFSRIKHHNEIPFWTRKSYDLFFIRLFFLWTKRSFFFDSVSLLTIQWSHRFRKPEWKLVLPWIDVRWQLLQQQYCR